MSPRSPGGVSHGVFYFLAGAADQAAPSFKMKKKSLFIVLFLVGGLGFGWYGPPLLYLSLLALFCIGTLFLFFIRTVWKNRP